ncbi:MAG TPA: Ig-like domain-containing protein [Sporichthyaceae bacterium]|jgi:hypothetical protein|nr:Ig-like domain-containing protein [Sporichthyaceae bacterium]
MGSRPTRLSAARIALCSLLALATGTGVAAAAQITTPGNRSAVGLSGGPASGGTYPVVGTTIRDRATLTGGFHPTGTITFTLYDDPGSCTGGVFQDSETVAPTGTVTSQPYIASVAGTYQWVAAYSGDPNNNAVTGSCSDVSERVTVVPSGSGPGEPGGPGGHGCGDCDHHRGYHQWWRYHRIHHGGHHWWRYHRIHSRPHHWAHRHHHWPWADQF